MGTRNVAGRRLGAAVAMLLLAAPAAAQSTIEIKNVSVRIENVSQPTNAAWTLLGFSGSLVLATPWYAASFAMPAGLSHPATAVVEFLESTGAPICRLEIDITGPLSCTPKPPAGGCVLLSWGSGSDLCSVNVRRGS